MDIIATGLLSLDATALSSLGQMLTFFLAGIGDSSSPAGALLGVISSTVGVRVVQLEEDDPCILGVEFEEVPLT